MDHAEDFSISHNAKRFLGDENAQKVNLAADPTVQAGKAAEEMNDAEREPGEYEHENFVSGDATEKEQQESDEK